MTSLVDLLLTCERDAEISDDGRYLYSLTREWGDGPTLLFVMLNPSTADARQDDATIRRCIRLAHAHRFPRLVVVNLFAFRATEPEDLVRAGFPVGPDNHPAIDLHASMADAICVAWGASAAHPAVAERISQVVPMLRRRHPLRCLGTTRSGHPRHPLFVPAEKRMEPWMVGA